MKVIRISSLCAAIFLLASCAAGSKSVDFPEMGDNHDENYKITGNAIPAVETDALRGDGDAALKLFFHHEYYIQNHRLAMYWLQIAAEDGNRSAARHLGEMMKADNDDPKHYLRADFWLQKAGK